MDTARGDLIVHDTDLPLMTVPDNGTSRAMVVVNRDQGP
jgi:hypothetical protein